MTWKMWANSPSQSSAINNMWAEHLLSCGDIKWKTNRAACDCTESFWISFFFFMSNNIFPDFTSISTPLRHHTFIIRGALSKIIWPRASSPSFPTTLCAPRSHKRLSTYAPWLLILQKRSRARRLPGALPQIIFAGSCAQPCHCKRSGKHRPLVFTWQKNIFKTIWNE